MKKIFEPYVQTQQLPFNYICTSTNISFLNREGGGVTSSLEHYFVCSYMFYFCDKNKEHVGI